MNSFKEKFKIAKILASLFTHSSTPEEEKNYRAWLDENPEHQKIADRILNKETYEENSRLIKSFSSQKAWEKVYPLLGGNQSGTVFSWKKSLKYAALILLLLVPASYFIYHWISEETISDITPGTLGGELILSDGKSFNLSDNNLPENAVRAFVIDSKGINYHSRQQTASKRNPKHTTHIAGDGMPYHAFRRHKGTSQCGNPADLSGLFQ